MLPITSFVVAWLETWFLDFKVLTQEAEEERGGGRAPEKLDHNPANVCFLFITVFPSVTTAYLAMVNAACERAPMIYPRAVSDGQFYSPPESVAGDLCLLMSIDEMTLQYGLLQCVCPYLSSKLTFDPETVSAGSDEDLDEEGLGRKAVTAQVLRQFLQLLY